MDKLQQLLTEAHQNDMKQELDNQLKQSKLRKQYVIYMLHEMGWNTVMDTEMPYWLRLIKALNIAYDGKVI